MITTINENDFIKAFKTFTGLDENFSREGLQELYKYYTDYEDSTGEPVELDCIAMACDWTEYESKYVLVHEYNDWVLSTEDAFNEIKEKTQVIEFDVWNDPKYAHKKHYLVMNF
tara:strand:- start:1663 stop:2004 length:342 start_codon:yes stop_codon:yes gene_type:complete